jgi:PTH2 family peptidyl-tRNA hydrolase
METKQVIVLRKDLNMRKGKMVAQGAHASMKVFFDRMSEISKTHIEVDFTDEMREWFNGTFTKVCVGVSSEQELLAVYQAACDAGLPCSLITDAGKTEFGGVPTKTAVAVGPAACADVDKITGQLGLL